MRVFWDSVARALLLKALPLPLLRQVCDRKRLYSDGRCVTSDTSNVFSMGRRSGGLMVARSDRGGRSADL